MSRQTTVRSPVELEGVSLHHGGPVRLQIRPAPPHTGLVFVREDRGGADVPALQQFRAPMLHATRIEREGLTVDTPEHLLAALFALGVDNAWLHLNGPEVPILDGSALPFAYALRDVGLETQSAPRAELAITRPVAVGDEDRRLEIHPSDRLRLTAGIDFEHRHLGYQELTVELDDPEDFLRKLAPARTFALASDVDKLRRAGLVRGGSLDNAVVVGDDGVVGGELRFADEFVRHKLLDLVGDLALMGCRLRGRVIAWRAGHELHGRLVDAILADPSAWIYEASPGGPEMPRARPTPPSRLRAG
ncbi:MAG: UDP-3-O-[3-hydroxymyristoyl] N-acetylglucosamine deacetylase [Acidobacteriota bacterium]|nr:MAG: UDP-3-O-[3-hydroxymyristoyl] N-acetylglucosamine deacetylase [Acidobacteriota bacterium]